MFSSIVFFRTLEKEIRHKIMVSWKTVQDSKGRTKTEYETLWKVDEMNDDLGTSADNPDVSTVRMPPGVELVFFGDVCD